MVQKFKVYVIRNMRGSRAYLRWFEVDATTAISAGRKACKLAKEQYGGTGFYALEVEAA